MITKVNFEQYNLDPEVIGLPGSLNIVEGMAHCKTRERKKIFIDGSSDEMVENLSEILFENMQLYP